MTFLAVSAAVFVRTWRTATGAAAEAEARRQSARQLALTDSGLAAFLDSGARPLLRESAGRELAAVRAAVQRVDEAFARYEEGIDAFARDLTGWGTRFRLIWRKGVETAERKDEHSWTAALVQQKFAKHVVSAERLEQDVLEATRQFAWDLEAARNELFASLATRLEASSLPVQVRQSVMDGFAERFEERMREMLKSLPSQSLAIGAGSLTAGIAAEEAVRHLVRVVIAQAAARVAAGAAAGGGAAAAAATAGGAGGTAVAPGVGTAIGVAGGLIAGVVIDWWMTDRFEAKVREQCRTFLAATRDALVTGPDGMEALLTTEARRAADAWNGAVIGSLQAAAR